jgi:hypothetical protein
MLINVLNQNVNFVNALLDFSSQFVASVLGLYKPTNAQRIDFVTDPTSSLTPRFAIMLCSSRQ